MLKEVDIFDSDITELESKALWRMLKKREQYVDQGRTGEAHGAGTMIYLLWNTLKGNEVVNTGYQDIL